MIKKIDGFILRPFCVSEQLSSGCYSISVYSALTRDQSPDVKAFRGSTVQLHKAFSSLQAGSVMKTSPIVVWVALMGSNFAEYSSSLLIGSKTIMFTVSRTNTVLWAMCCPRPATGLRINDNESLARIPFTYCTYRVSLVRVRDKTSQGHNPRPFNW